MIPPIKKFTGFVPPEKNFFQMPNEWIDICSEIRDISELKVIQYILRHTWGFHEYGICKTISVDEFMQGRRRQDGSRMDKGTGLSEQSVRNGIKQAIEDGYLVYEIDTSDAGRIKKSYSLKMRIAESEVQTLYPPQTLDPLNSIPQGTNPYTSDSQSLDPRVPEFRPRTEKDTIRKTLKKDTEERQEREVATATARSQPSSQNDLSEDTVKREAVKPSQKEVVRGHHQHRASDNHLPAHSDLPDPVQSKPQQEDTNKVGHPPAPSKAHLNTSPFPVPKRAKPQSNIMDEISLTPDEQVVFDAWCSLFKVEVPLIPANAKACKQLVKPLQVWTDSLHESTAQVLKRIMNWAYKNDKNGYYKRGFKLYDAAREFEAWQSAQERPQGDKEESNEHKATQQPANAFIERCLDKDYNKRQLEKMRAENERRRQAQAGGVQL